MLHEIRDLDGNLIARQRATDEEATLHIIDPSTGQSVLIDGLDALMVLRELVEDILADRAEE